MIQLIEVNGNTVMNWGANKKAVDFVIDNSYSASYKLTPDYEEKYVEESKTDEFDVEVSVTVQNIYCVENTYTYDVKVMKKNREFLVVTGERRIDTNQEDANKAVVGTENPIEYDFSSDFDNYFSDSAAARKAISDLTASDFEKAKPLDINGEELILIAELKEQNITLYQYNSSHGVFLIMSENYCQVIPNQRTLGRLDPPLICIFDYDQDGEQEIAMAILVEHGTQIQHQKLYMLDKQGGENYNEIVYDENEYMKVVSQEMLAEFSTLGVEFQSIEDQYNWDAFTSYWYASGEEYSMSLNDLVYYRLNEDGAIQSVFQSAVHKWNGSESGTATYERKFSIELIYNGTTIESGATVMSDAF